MFPAIPPSSNNAAFRLPEFAAGVKVALGTLDRGREQVRRTTRAAAADTRDAAFLGRHAGGLIAPAALQRLPQGLFPAAALLPRLRRARSQRLRGERQGPDLLLCDPS